MVVCDFKLFLYDCSVDRSGTKTTEINPFVSLILDMRDEAFSVSSVTEADVIHAIKSDVQKIFRVATSQIHVPMTHHGAHESGDSTGEEGRIL